MASNRVHPSNDDLEHWSRTDNKPLNTTPNNRRGAYEVDEGIEDGVDFGSTNGAQRQFEIVGKTSSLLSRRLVVFFLTFVSLVSVTTLFLTVLIIYGKIGNRCNCADSMTESQQDQG